MLSIALPHRGWLDARRSWSNPTARLHYRLRFFSSKRRQRYQRPFAAIMILSLGENGPGCGLLRLYRFRRFAVPFPRGRSVSCSGSRVGCVMILSMLVCSVATADSFTSFSDMSASRFRNAGVPLHEVAARLTGVSPFAGPFLPNDSRREPMPVRFVYSPDWDAPQHTYSSGNQTLDLVIGLFQHLIAAPRHPPGQINGNHK